MGAVLFVAAFVTFWFLFLVEILTGDVNPYVGLFHLLVLPTLGTIGLLMMGLDIGRTRVQHRLLLTTALIAGGLIFAMAAGGQRAYEFTESTAFCGDVCHPVMRPEAIAHRNSPHARIACVDCHVGDGARYYIRAKLTGVYQVYATLTDSFPRPVPTPVHSMRPAQDTCEECHWSEFSFGEPVKSFTHYLSDGGEEPWVIEMLLRLGGGDPSRGYDKGIHTHMSGGIVVEYVARDERRIDVAWVRMVDENGEVTTYEDVENPPGQEVLGGVEPRRIDCIDCHNRPAHVYRSPVELVNREMGLGNLSPEMPDIKFPALELLAAEYTDPLAAEEAIGEGLMAAYADDFPDYYAEDRAAVERAAATLQRVYGENNFPEMGVRWDTYPRFIGHMSSVGCFRCHNGRLQTTAGRPITTACNACHTILRQGYASSPLTPDVPKPAFAHPGDGELMDELILCVECHDGALGLGG